MDNMASMDEQLPDDDEDLAKYMEERSKQLEQSKDASSGLTKDADQRVDLKQEVADLLEGVNGPKYVTEVVITVNGEKYESVPVNSLQWYMFRYGELMNDTLDIYEEPRPELEVDRVARTLDDE
mmetsp:Transcript_20420/g.50056  ORF Transcript_20420/g.50056 Transcript_20420/m.50056 type:complete len:124 (+) Transcript_20420:4357-4728(+)